MSCSVGTKSYTATRFGTSAHLVQDDHEGRSDDNPTHDHKHVSTIADEHVSIEEQAKSDLGTGQIGHSYGRSEGL